MYWGGGGGKEIANPVISLTMFIANGTEQPMERAVVCASCVLCKEIIPPSKQKCEFLLPIVLSGSFSHVNLLAGHFHGNLLPLFKD